MSFDHLRVFSCSPRSLGSLGESTEGQNGISRVSELTMKLTPLRRGTKHRCRSRDPFVQKKQKSSISADSPQKHLRIKSCTDGDSSLSVEQGWAPFLQPWSSAHPSPLWGERGRPVPCPSHFVDRAGGAPQACRGSSSSHFETPLQLGRNGRVRCGMDVLVLVVCG